MKVCKNTSLKKYNGKENTPLGRGYSASVEKLGNVKKGKDGEKYIVVKWGNEKRWSQVKKKKKNQKGFFDWAKKSPLYRSFNKNKTNFDDMPVEIVHQFISECDEMIALRATSSSTFYRKL